MEPDEILSTDGTSRLTKLPPGTLRWMRSKGKGPKWFALTERKIMYKRSDVIEWIEDRYNHAETKPAARLPAGHDRPV